MIETFAQKRLIDGLEYHFVLDGEYNGRPAYIRMDGQVLYRWHDRSWWVACSPDGTENGWPVFPEDSLSPREWPVWSHKGEKSYTYLLIHTPDKLNNIEQAMIQQLAKISAQHAREDIDPRMSDWIRNRVIEELGL